MPLTHDHHHPLLRFGEHHLVGAHPFLTTRHPGHVDADTGATSGSGLQTGGGAGGSVGGAGPGARGRPPRPVPAPASISRLPSPSALPLTSFSIVATPTH